MSVCVSDPIERVRALCSHDVLNVPISEMAGLANSTLTSIGNVRQDATGTAHS